MNVNKKIQILLSLQHKLNEKYLCIYILNILQNIIEKEEKETLEYHKEKWNTIAGSYFKCTKPIPLSYVINYEHYRIFKDDNMDFYNQTGISFQIRDLVLSIIKISTDKEWRKYDDKIYAKLARKIHYKMLCDINI